MRSLCVFRGGEFGEGALTEEGVKYSQAVPFVITLLDISHYTRKCVHQWNVLFYFLFCLFVIFQREWFMNN